MLIIKSCEDDTSVGETPFLYRGLATLVPVAGVDRIRIYVHGEAERALKFDIPAFSSGVFDLNNPAHPCLFETSTGVQIPGMVYTFTRRERGYTGCLFGYAVAADDLHAVATATANQVRRPAWLF